jgi:hypothetical protein
VRWKVSISGVDDSELDLDVLAAEASVMGADVIPRAEHLLAHRRSHEEPVSRDESFGAATLDS